jgi:RNA polymerase sigma factor (sigma-70 family)
MVNREKEERAKHLSGLVKGGVYWAFEELAGLYCSMVEGLASGYSGRGFDRDDVRQAVLLGLWSAAMTYDEEKVGACPFGSFAKMCAKRRVITLLRSATNRRSLALNSCFSLCPSRQINDWPMSWQDDSWSANWGEEEHLFQAKTKTPLQQDIAKVEAEEFLSKLTPGEREVFLSRISMPGYSPYVTIQEKTGLTWKQIDNTISREIGRASCRERV